MSTLSIRIAESLHQKIKEIAAQENISINQFVNAALAEKISALLTEEYLSARAKRGSREKFEQALSKVADVAPEEADRINEE